MFKSSNDKICLIKFVYEHEICYSYTWIVINYNYYDDWVWKIRTNLEPCILVRIVDNDNMHKKSWNIRYLETKISINLQRRNWHKIFRI